MVGDNSPPGGRAAQVVRDAAAGSWGSSVNCRRSRTDHVHEVLRRAEERPYVCPNTGWFKDFFDSQTLLDPTFNGASHRPGEQLELASAERQDDQQATGQGQADR